MAEQEHTGSVVRVVRSGGSLDHARLLVENLLRAHGLDPTRHLLSQGEDSCSWLFWASAPAAVGADSQRTLLVMSVFSARGASYFRVSSPILILPGEELLAAFCWRLLDLNAEMVSAALATVGGEVHVVSVRPVQGLDGSEAEAIIRCVTGYACTLKESLQVEFGARPWELVERGDRPGEEVLDDPSE